MIATYIADALAHTPSKVGRFTVCWDSIPSPCRLLGLHTHHNLCCDGKDATSVHRVLEREGPNLDVEIGYDDVNYRNGATFYSPRAELGPKRKDVLQKRR